METSVFSNARKVQIDEMTYTEMLRVWRFADSENELIQGEIGRYFAKKITEKRKEVGEAGHVAASKEIGWGA